MNIDFSMPINEWQVSHLPYKNSTEKWLIKWANMAAKEGFYSVYDVHTYLNRQLDEYAKTHKSHANAKHNVAIKISEDYKSVIVTVNRAVTDKNPNKYMALVIREDYEDLIIITKLLA